MTDDPALTSAQRDLLARIAADDVTYRHAGTGVSFRLWSTQYDYTTVTPKVRALITRGLARTVPGWRYGRGSVEVTPAGRAALSVTDQAT